MALQLTSSADLPSVGYMVLLDKVYNVSYTVIFLTLLESVVAVRLADAGREASAHRLDRVSLGVLGALFFPERRGDHPVPVTAHLSGR